jgi:hypothetical protein
MDKVFRLWHFRIASDQEADPGDPAQVPMEGGLYSTEDNAKAAIDRVRDRTEFRAWPEGFRIYQHALDVDHWEQGFISWDEA